MTFQTIGVGMIGHGFMGKAHSLGYRDVAVIAPSGIPRPELVAICGRDPTALTEAKERYGWSQAVTDWRLLVADPAIGLIDNCAPNSLHLEPTLAAARAGKHVYCEKPLGPTAEDSFRAWQDCEAAGVVHMCAFNYRFFPALQLAREIIASGELGTIRHWRSNFLLSFGLSAARRKGWRDERSSGFGSLGDIGSHHLDLSRFLLQAEPVRVVGRMRQVVAKDAEDRDLETDDFFAAIVEFDNDTLAVFEGSRVAGGRLVTNRIEVDGSKGSLGFSLEHLNELHVIGGDHVRRTIPVTRAGDPYQELWFPPGHPLGWVHVFSHEAIHLLGAIAGRHSVGPVGASFRDGYYCAEIVDTIARAAVEGRFLDVNYRA
jgi:predicted dehydrogenase